VRREAVDATGKRRSRSEVSRLADEYLSNSLSLKALCRQHNPDGSTSPAPTRQGSGKSSSHRPAASRLGPRRDGGGARSGFRRRSPLRAFTSIT